MNIFDEENFKVFERTVQRIDKEYRTILSVFGDDVHDYIAHTETPYDITIPLQNVLKFVENNYVEICSQVVKVFDNTQQLNNTVDNFTKYYEKLVNVIEDKTNTPEVMSTKIALVLILASKNVSNLTTKKMQVILKSMCKMPTVGVLVQVSANVLSDV